MKAIKLIGEMPVFGESSASMAISRLNHHLDRTTRSFETFFTMFQLVLDDWQVKLAHHEAECFYMDVEATVYIKESTTEKDLHHFINQHNEDLYLGRTGFLPIRIIEVESQPEKLIA